MRHVSLASLAVLLMNGGRYHSHITEEQDSNAIYLTKKKRFLVALTCCCSLCLCLSSDVSLSVHCYVSRAERQNSLKLFIVLSLSITTIEISKCHMLLGLRKVNILQLETAFLYFSLHLFLHVIYIVICNCSLYKDVVPGYL